MLDKIRKFLHDFLGWGYFASYDVPSDTFQPTATYRFCRTKIAQDSTGAWFHLSRFKRK